MLSTQDNELLTHVGPGTPMGNFLRQYWIPAIPASLLPAPDCPPMRVRLLCENLIAFRATSGQVGMVANACPHRGASLFFGRNEEEGLRCVYHGWKFDVDGSCIDMPSEPVESNFKSKVRVGAYPCREVNGMVWTYMGTRETLPSLPDFEFNRAPAENCSHPTFHFYDCNWMQALEGDIDSSHIDYLHSRITPELMAEIRGQAFFNRDRTPKLHAVPTEYGAVYSARRQWDEEGNYWYRISQYCMPFYVMIPPGNSGRAGLDIWLPLDDEHTLLISLSCNLNEPVAPEQRLPTDPYAGLGGYLSPTSDPLTRWRPPAHVGNDYMRDYELERTKMFTGIPRDPKTQDLAMTESMGAINNRTLEHLGTSDNMIILVRRLLLNAAKALQDEGAVHPTVDNAAMYRVRSAQVVLPESVDWLEGTETQRRAIEGQPVATVIVS